MLATPIAARTDEHGPPRYTWGAAAVVTAAAAAFQFLSLSNLTNDHYMYLALAQQVLLGEVPEHDFEDPGAPLQYLLSAAVQSIAPGPFAEAVLTMLLAALAVGATCVAVSWLTGSVRGAVAAAAFAIVLQTRLYSYPKILVPAVAVCLGLAYTRRPGGWRRAALATWVAVAFLFRYDLGGYAALFAALVVMARQQAVRDRLLELGRLAGLIVLLLLPYVAFVATAPGGMVEALLSSVEFAKDEPGFFGLELPSLGLGAFQEGGSWSLGHWDRLDSAAFLVYVSNALPFVSALLLLAAARQGRMDHLRAPVVAGAALMILCYDIVIIRHPIESRIGDCATLIAIVGAWCVAAASAWARETPPAASMARICARAALAVLVAAAFLSADLVGNFHDHVRETRIGRPSKVRERVRVVLTDGRSWPWQRYWPGEPLPELIEYLRTCTSRDDRLLLTWGAPEFYFFARRGFATGHVWFPQGGAYRSSKDQRRMIERLEGRSVPIVLIHEGKRADLEALSLLDEYVASQYVAAGRVATPDGSEITVSTKRELIPRSSFGDAGWPCELAPDEHATGDL